MLNRCTHNRRLATDQRGVAAIEYALILSLIALALVGALFKLGGSVENSFEQTNRAVASGTEFESG